MTMRTLVFSDVGSAFGIPHFYEMLGNPDCQVVGLVLAHAKAEDGCRELQIMDRWGIARGENLVRTADSCGIPVLRTESTHLPSFLTRIKELKPEILVSAGFRRILPVEVLRAAEIAAVNFHPSLLPRMRGSDPWFWTILNGETESAATVHYMTERLDAGDIILQSIIRIDAFESAGTLFQKTLVESLRLVEPLFRALRTGNVPRTPQDETKASVYPSPRPEDFHINWASSAKRIFNLVRAAKYTPGAWTTFQNRRVVIVEAEPGTDASMFDVPARPGALIKRSAQALLVRAGEGNLVVRALSYENQTWNAARFVSFFRCGSCPDEFV
jgi:methionyl-tRNA formyltransferase